MTCPVCGGNAREALRFDDVRVYRCEACGHRFTDPTALRAEKQYDDAYWQEEHANWFANPHVELFDWIADQIETRTPARSVVDVGSGGGQLLERLRQRLPDAALTGIDLAPSPVDGVEILADDFLAMPLDGRTWDAAVSLATIEHVADVGAFAARLRAIVPTGGVAIVMTLDDSGLLYVLARLLNRLGHREPAERLYERHHLNHFSTKSLRTLLERHGFHRVALHRTNVPLAAVDLPRESSWLKLEVAAIFALGTLLRRTYLQTIVVEAV
jgi:SAM-dependent methyltransferase